MSGQIEHIGFPMVYRSLLYVPGARPDRFDKAVASGADAVCIDLEDAVALSSKKEARAASLEYLATKPASTTAIGLRINALTSLDGFRDVIALADRQIMPDFVMVPKASGGAELRQLREVLNQPELCLWPLMESPEGLMQLSAMAQAVGPTGGIMFGGADFSAALGADMGWDALYHGRASLVAAASLVGCEAMDVPYLNVKDDEGLRQETARVKSIGFTGRACIHPMQVPIVNEIFTPSTEEIETAQNVVSAYEAASGGVALLDGKLIEKPVLRAAERILSYRKD